MSLMSNTTFACIDCESTGLDCDRDRIIEVAVVLFRGSTILEQFESLVDPGMPIPKDSQQIHHISDKMCAGKPKIESLLPEIHKLVGAHPIVGHGVGFDIDLLHRAALRRHISTRLKSNLVIDTLRLARLYGELPSNSLESLRHHFNIPTDGAHRAMGDVQVNVRVFLQLTRSFETFEALTKRLEKPIEIKVMPLGKHKGRSFRDIPLEYLQWALAKRFDGDLRHTIQKEMRRRKQTRTFSQATNPFEQI